MSQMCSDSEQAATKVHIGNYMVTVGKWMNKSDVQQNQSDCYQKIRRQGSIIDSGSVLSYRNDKGSMSTAIQDSKVFVSCVRLSDPRSSNPVERNRGFTRSINHSNVSDHIVGSHESQRFGPIRPTGSAVSSLVTETSNDSSANLKPNPHSVPTFLDVIGYHRHSSAAAKNSPRNIAFDTMLANPSDVRIASPEVSHGSMLIPNNMNDVNNSRLTVRTTITDFIKKKKKKKEETYVVIPITASGVELESLTFLNETSRGRLRAFGINSLEQLVDEYCRVPRGGRWLLINRFKIDEVYATKLAELIDNYQANVQN